MDNYTLRVPDPTSDMPDAMATEVRRRTEGGRVAATWRWADQFKLTSGLDMQANQLDTRSQMGAENYASLPRVPSATMWNLGVFSELTWYATASQRVIAGMRVDQAGERDYRTMTGGMMTSMPNPTAHDVRSQTLESGFLRYEQDLAAIPVMPLPNGTKKSAGIVQSPN